jgi:hypothetical protein
MNPQKKTITNKHTRVIPPSVVDTVVREFEAGTISIDSVVNVLKSNGIVTYSMRNDIEIMLYDMTNLRQWMNAIAKVCHDVKTARDKRKLLGISTTMSEVRKAWKEAIDNRDASRYHELSSKYNRLQEVLCQITSSGTVI